MPQVTSGENEGDFTPPTRPLALIALGSNQSFAGVDAAEIVRAAVVYLAQEVGVIRSESRLFSTPAFPSDSGPDFVNGAVAIETLHDAQTLLTRLHAIEARFGRDRAERWGPRTLDLDLIAVGDLVLPDREIYLKWAGLPLETQLKETPERLILPHPRLHERAFVLVPLLDVAPEWQHPVTGHSVAQMCAALPDPQKDEVQPL